MLTSPHLSPVGRLSKLEELAVQLNDLRPHPQEEALAQLGHVMMTELLDLLMGTALEDQLPTICEALIGGFHSASQRIERDADKARDRINDLARQFDGSEIADTELQEATAKALAEDVAGLCVDMIRDSASETYTSATGEVWAPWRGSVKASRTTAAQIEAREAIRAAKARRQGACDPGAQVVAFRASPQADTADDAGRIFDALNWAREQWPDMALATTGASGGERLAIKWARQKGVKLVLAKADFGANGRAAPFRANDQLLQLEPVVVLTLANTLNPDRAAALQPFGPALNLAQKAGEKGVRCLDIRARR